MRMINVVISGGGYIEVHVLFLQIFYRFKSISKYKVFFLNGQYGTKARFLKCATGPDINDDLLEQTNFQI